MRNGDFTDTGITLSTEIIKSSGERSVLGGEATEFMKRSPSGNAVFELERGSITPELDLRGANVHRRESAKKIKPSDSVRYESSGDVLYEVADDAPEEPPFIPRPAMHQRRTIRIAVVATILGLAWMSFRGPATTPANHTSAPQPPQRALASLPNSAPESTPPTIASEVGMAPLVAPPVEEAHPPIAEFMNYGHLTLYSTPSAIVTISSKVTGRQWLARTPIAEIKLPPGSYSVSLRNPILRMGSALDLQIKDGQYLTQDVRLKLSP